MTVNDAVEFFGAIPKIARKLQTIKDVRECLDQDLIDFFKSSAPTEKTE